MAALHTVKPVHVDFLGGGSAKVRAERGVRHRGGEARGEKQPPGLLGSKTTHFT